MEGGEVRVNGRTSKGYACGVSCGNGLGQACSGNGLEQVYSETGQGRAGVSEDVNGNLAEVVLEDWENYLEDVSDRLRISRMVSDSVIKGMVTAVEQDCAERIAAKELEVARLKESLQSSEVGPAKYEDLCEIQNMNWLQKFNDIASLGTKLKAIQKSLSMPEAELVSHGSHDLDNLHHMSKEELVAHFNNIITKIKRDYESDLYRVTDENFRLKREYLNMKGSFVEHMKYAEFDVLRREITEVSSKLENFLSENERFPALTSNLESRKNMKHRLENLHSENHHLRDCLNDKGNEVKCLKEQVASAASEILQHSLAEENLLKLVESLQSAAKDSGIEASLNEEIYKSVLREQIAQTRCSSEDSDMEFFITREIYDIILREACIHAETANKYGIEDSDIESLIMQGFNAVVFTEIIRDAGRRLENLQQKVRINEEEKTCLERKSLEKENELRLEVEEKEKLKQELRLAMEHKEKLAMVLSVSLSKVREQSELASQYLITLREHASRQQMLVTESNRELESLRSEHLEALEQIEVYKTEMNKLEQKLAQTEALSTEANREKNKALTLILELHDKLSLSETREQTLMKEMEMAADRFSKLFADFECRVSRVIKITSLRLQDTSSQLKAISGMANVLRRSELMYKQKVDKGNTDLQMAETEVDLLGDKVDALLRILEKIYIALDHYSPVLKHYPGIIEILELLRRELSGESTILS